MSSKAKSPSTSNDLERLRAAETEISQTLSLELSAEAWDALGDCLEKFGKAWQENPEVPPRIVDFLPNRPGLRQVAIVELVKLDMEHRHGTKAARTTLEDYAQQFPDLGGVDRIPAELIYEEYLVRRQTESQLALDEYLKRYPRQSAELKALASVHEVPVGEVRRTTSITSIRRPDSLNVGERVDDFDLLCLLGQGSFAKVFLARQISLQRLVALKVSAARGFESQTLAQLDHPNIVRVHDQRRLPERNLQLLYMQYMPGGTLSDVVQRVKRTPAGTRTSQILLEVVRDRLNDQGEGVSEVALPSALRGASWWKTVTWLGMHLAGALDHAHARGVLHRDLKPANVLLGRDGNPRLADFNVSASTVVASHVSAAYFGGSLAYMSPEQLDAFSAPPEEREAMMDARSDVFSLGILLWEVLTGARPYREEQIADLDVDTLVALANRRRSGPTEEEWKALAAEAPSGLVQFFRKCLSASPADRYESAAAARRALTLCCTETSRNLLQLRAKGLTAWCKAHPWWALIALGVIPSLASSSLNIPFNYALIVQPMKSETAWVAFLRAILVINPVAYLMGIGIAVLYARPVIRAAKDSIKGNLGPMAVRYRSVLVPEVVAWITALLWLISGLVFPVLLSQSHEQLGASQYFYFITSQAICGTLAASLAFTFIAMLSLNALVPPLIDAKEDDPAMFARLEGLGKRSNIYEFLAGAVGPAAALLIVISDTGGSRLAFGVFAAAGFACFGLIYWLKRKMIDPDIAALKATTMIEDSMGGDTQSSIAPSTRPRG